MAIVRVSAHDGTGSTSATFGGTPTLGNLLLAVVQSAFTTPTLTGWTSIKTNSSIGPGTITLFAKTSAGTEGTVTPSSASAVCVCEYSGAANPYVTDGTANTSTGSGTSLATGTISTTNANDLIFVVAFAENGSATSPSWTTSVEILTNKANGLLFSGQNIVTSTQTNFSDTAQWTTAASASTIIAAFQAPAAAPSYVPPTVHTSAFASIQAGLRMVAFPNVPWHQRRRGLALPAMATKKLVLAGA